MGISFYCCWRGRFDDDGDERDGGEEEEDGDDDVYWG